MPKRGDIKTILLLGSGPIVIGQGCEFDYSGTQACKALKAEGYRIVLVNSNPATIMTDPQFSDRTYIEPITPEAVRKIIEREYYGEPDGATRNGLRTPSPTKIDAILPTLGGQTALNCACKLWDDGTLQEFGIEMIGANREVIHRAEDRQMFKDICEGIGLTLPKAKTVTTLEDAEAFLAEIGLPAIVRPAFTLGGTGGGIAYNREEFRDIVTRGLAASMIRQVQIDQSVIGWKEYELEVVRDKKDNCIIVCGIENIDAMGVHTGDSITVAPILTLTDKEYQAMRDAALAIMRAVGVETGGSNVQFAVNPDPKPGPDGTRAFEMVVVEMNPRVSRSSALASKATGFPIAKIAAKLAVGYTLDELKNDVTGTTSACFEPTIDYVVTKMPRWTFEKFPEADETLTTQMKSVGEAMAIGRTFAESLQKVIRSMDVKRFGLGLDRNDMWLAARRAGKAAGGKAPVPARTADGKPVEWPPSEERLSRKLAVPSQGRLYFIRYALKLGWSVEKIAGLTRIDPFFLDQMQRLVEFEDELLRHERLEDVPAETLFEAKRLGYSDAQLANVYFGEITTDAILKVRERRRALAIEPVYKLVDTCAAEFEAVTPYYYSTYERGAVRAGGEGAGAFTGEDEIRVSPRKKVVILGGGPNRVGQGIEFDYCCVHAAFAARDLGFESVMINSNPETVSTDYDTSDLLFFEPLTLEDTLNVVERLNRLDGLGVASAEFLCRKEMVGFFADHANPSAPPDLDGLVARAVSQHGLGPTAVFHLEADKKRGGIDFHAVSWDRRVWSMHSSPAERSHAITVTPLALARWDRYTEKHEEQSHRSAVEMWLSRVAGAGLVHGLIVQFGGQTPLNLTRGLHIAGAPIIGTSVDSIDLAEDRKRFDHLLERLGLMKPPSGTANTVEGAAEVASRIGYPVLVRPSYVIGGRGMEICPDETQLRRYMGEAAGVSDNEQAPVLIDKFLDDATECDVDVLADYIPGRAGLSDREGANDGYRRSIIAGVMEHIEQAGIHSGDSTCTLPPPALPPAIVEQIRLIARLLAAELRVCGLMNLQLAVKGDSIYILEVNPRASRTVPYVGKATGLSWAYAAAKVMMGKRIVDLGLAEPAGNGAFAVKAPVFPFTKFPGVDVVLGPEMRSTGEVMGMDGSADIAFVKALMGAGVRLPTSGSVYLSVRAADRDDIVGVAKSLRANGMTIFSSPGTASYLGSQGVVATVVPKIETRIRPNVLDLMTDGKIQLVLNTPTRTGRDTDEGQIRAAAIRLGVPLITTTSGAQAAARAIGVLKQRGWSVAALQDYATTNR